MNEFKLNYLYVCTFQSTHYLLIYSKLTYYYIIATFVYSTTHKLVSNNVITMMMNTQEN
jgi:hypothetical protein